MVTVAIIELHIVIGFVQMLEADITETQEYLNN